MVLAEEKEGGALEMIEDSLGFNITTTSERKKPFKYLLGPYCKRTKYKPGRNVTRALGNRKLKDSHTVLDAYGRTAFANPKQMDTTAPLYGPDVSALDGLVIREVPVEPYMLTRACHERGATGVMDCMEEYSSNRHIVLFGLISLAKMDIVETEDGVASKEVRERDA